MVELELDSNQFANIYKADGLVITNGMVSDTFTIDDVAMVGDVLTLDSSLNNN